MRETPLINEEIYHIYNRGVDKRDIFSTSFDLERFLISMKYFNTKKPVGSIYQCKLQKNKNNLVSGIIPLVEILSYNILPNHFHFILKQKIDGGVSEFMKRLLGGYTNYFNDKQKRSGSLFQGRFKSIHVDNDDYLLILLGYVNYNDFIHNISDKKKKFTKSSIKEIETGNYYLLDKIKTTKYILEKFGSVPLFEKHCKEIAEIIKNKREEMILPEGYLFETI
ncbi:MAG: transposase [Candidatus Paceibacterota bacterium]